MPLKVIVIGAGVAGPTAATSLSQAGHSVQIFEKSSFKTEIGAALNLLPNAAHVLTKLGFNFQRALVGKHLRLETVNGITLESLTLVDLTHVEKEYGGDVQSILRADLHSELLLLSQQGPNPASLHLGSLVKRVDSTEGTVELESGAVHTADLIIAADGAHSVCRQEVLGYDQPSVGSGKSAFRFLIPSETIEKSEPIKEFLQGRAPGATILADVQDKLKTRHLTWYECHGGTLHNFVGIFPAEQHVEGVDQKTMLLKQFQHFHPQIVGLLELADDVRVWPLLFDEPLERYSRGKLLLLGDAAQAMLPFSGQGACQAIEGAGLVGLMFQDADVASVPKKLKQFENMRSKRIALIQMLSRIRFGRESEAAYALIKHDQVNPKDVPTSFHERLLFEWRYNIYEEFPKWQQATSQANDNNA